MADYVARENYRKYSKSMAINSNGLGGPRYATALSVGIRTAPEFIIDDLLSIPVRTVGDLSPVPTANFWPTSQSALEGYTLRVRIGGYITSGDTVTLHMLGKELTLLNSDFYEPGELVVNGKRGLWVGDFGGPGVTGPNTNFGDPVYITWSTTDPDRDLEDAMLYGHYNIIKPANLRH